MFEDMAGDPVGQAIAVAGGQKRPGAFIADAGDVEAGDGACLHLVHVVMQIGDRADHFRYEDDAVGVASLL